MEILVAKTAGFCFGVKKAIEKAFNEKGDRIFTYGPIIHNKQVVEELKDRGIDVVENLDNIQPNDKIIVRSHGISKGEYEKIEQMGAVIVDATCPYVKHIHKIVEQRFNDGYKIIIVGDENHPEVKGINGWCNNTAIIINEIEDLNKIDKNLGRICIVAQTTFNQNKWYKISSELIKSAKEILIYNTICSATDERQNEAIELSNKVDVMVVIGGKNSSNSRKLYEICRDNCKKAIFIEDENELNLDEVAGASKVGITAGASTPDYTIKAVIEKLDSLNKLEDRTYESDDEIDYNFKNLSVGEIVEGRVIHITNDEVFFDIGYKADGILPKNLASNRIINLKEIFKIGDVYDLEVVKLLDKEGNVVLSRLNIEKYDIIDELEKIKEEGILIKVKLISEIKGGYECLYNNIKAFLPESHSGITQRDEVKNLLGKEIEVNILDVKLQKNDNIEIVVSRKNVIKKIMEEEKRKFIEELSFGQELKGRIKSFIESGIFVTVGPMDVFVPNSEVSWDRKVKPQKEFKINQEVNIVITKINKNEHKVSGSIKRTMKEPWDEFISKYKEGDIITGKVVAFADYGAFVEIIEGVDGLIHISQITTRRINKPSDYLKIGQVVKPKIISIDYDKKKVSLSLIA
ncbi:MAG: bifunctional 4-hydroxy-3-methylbut-2-enyl diphosphate reductase/30S ribosomal protein [Caloramator sp.]|jgi:4-hydroxy-3-methylbut-2-enyl diphosphate reductase|uniref:bifunctional 4-hydroxy-3-methylbut-2-enyl diphosphate reductase/30S ribosomal protein S1 n=1 Tax=Caloramator sp. TaxID=1871330 RepID=UPI001DC49B30|nr:bifunctional 4-hydroxy-3-methylbut-2-enyl diphosphate reductase/30S ribosomal protein S1 [Caloramator sp.]MBZ4662360.1 bifunctional 4-hydroxy-3-methylbut-2-enyl diphosphate reductase/30S ribosomal protein [Caloramator sp.]